LACDRKEPLAPQIEIKQKGNIYFNKDIGQELKFYICKTLLVFPNACCSVYVR
jgi:hypothetical protein